MGSNVNELDLATIGPHNLIQMYLSLQLHYSWPELEIGKTDTQLLSVLFEDSFWEFQYSDMGHPCDVSGVQIP